MFGRTNIRKNIHQQIVHEIASRIISGEIGPGETLSTEDAASAELDVSRTAYREAMKVLSAKGLVESRPKVGTRVRARSDWNMLDPDVLLWATEMGRTEDFADSLFEFRQVFEPAAARMAATRATREQKKKIRAALHRMEATTPATPENVNADLEFHSEILRASGNELLNSLSYVVQALLARSFAISSLRPDAHSASIPLHEAVCVAIEKADSAGAQHAMAVLLSGARADFDLVINTNTGPLAAAGGRERPRTRAKEDRAPQFSAQTEE